MARQRGGRRAPAAEKPPLTHFLCVPLVTQTSRQQLETSLDAFRRDVTGQTTSKDGSGERDLIEEEATESPPSTRINVKAVRPVGALHLTLGVMSLDAKRLEEAINTLQSSDVTNLLRETMKPASTAVECKQLVGGKDTLSERTRAISPSIVGRQVEPIVVTLQGLESMHARQKTSILYISPQDSTGRFYPLCKAIQKVFRDKGYLLPDDRELKLHATVVNTIYAKSRRRQARGRGMHTAHQILPSSDATEGNAGAESSIAQDDRSQGHGPNANAPLKIDATAVLNRYKDFMWAKNITPDRISICEMGAEKGMDESGRVTEERYAEIAIVEMPI